eukprot:361598-Chlamydomonas_euryale.AAC.1
METSTRTARSSATVSSCSACVSVPLAGLCRRWGDAGGAGGVGMQRCRTHNTTIVWGRRGAGHTTPPWCGDAGMQVAWGCGVRVVWGHGSAGGVVGTLRRGNLVRRRPSAVLDGQRAGGCSAVLREPKCRWEG